MTKRELNRLASELEKFLGSVLEGQGRPERRAALEQYMRGLLLDGERKSVEPMATRLVDDPREAEAVRQRLQQCLTGGKWDEAALWKRLAVKAAAELPNVQTLVLDDTGFAKKGDKSVGVGRQYSGTLGRTDNCQVATSLHLAGDAGSVCIGMRLYLPQAWTDDRKRCAGAGVPDDVPFLKKWHIALRLLDDALSWGIQRRVVLADAGYGDTVEFRDGLVERQLMYVVAMPGSTHVWPPGAVLHPPTPPKTGRPGTRWVAQGGKRHIAIGELAKTLRYRRIIWREGSKGRQSSRFAAVRVRSAERHMHKRPPGEEQWLMCEWPDGETAPTKFWFSNLPANTSVTRLVRLARLRWRVERDYQELKQEIGLDQFEGRTWTGFHRHAALCSAAHAFLSIRRALFPPEHDPMDAPHGPQSAAIRTAA